MRHLARDPFLLVYASGLVSGKTFRSFFFSFREKFSFLRKRNQRLFFLILIVDVLVVFSHIVDPCKNGSKWSGSPQSLLSRFQRISGICSTCVSLIIWLKEIFFFTRQIPRNIFILRSTNSFKNFSFLLLLFFLIHRFD